MAQVATQSTYPRSQSMVTRTASSGWVLAGDRPASTVQFEEEMVSFFVDAAELLGVPKSVAATYGIIFASPDPLSFSEISARLDFSNGSVSQGLKALREIGAIKATMTDKDKLERFIPDLELRKLVARFLEHRLKKQLDAGSTRLVGLKRAIPSGNKRASDELNRRLKSLSDWHTRANQLLPIARTFLKLTPG
jgi:DNA-binding transcriptional regulator GbsR (MarR family)